MTRVASDERIHSWAVERRLPEACLGRWLGLAEAERQAVLKVAEELRWRTGQFLTAYELLEEISVRENVPISSILERNELRRVIESNRSGPGKARRLLDALRIMRFPQLREVTVRLAKEVAALKLPANIRVILPRDLESGELRLEIVACGGDELRESLASLDERLAALCRLADSLDGSNEI
jgi:hypothetical protein